MCFMSQCFFMVIHNMTREVLTLARNSGQMACGENEVDV